MRLELNMNYEWYGPETKRGHLWAWEKVLRILEKILNHFITFLRFVSGHWEMVTPIVYPSSLQFFLHAAMLSAPIK